MGKRPRSGSVYSRKRATLGQYKLIYKTTITPDRYGDLRSFFNQLRRIHSDST